MCSFYGVSRSGYYDWLKREYTEGHDLQLRELILKCQQNNKWRYGYRRVRLWLIREYGLYINHKAVQRIMQKYNLHAKVRRKCYRHYIRNENLRYSNILNQDFTTTQPNQKWVTDITYIQTPEGTLYLSVIEDLYGNFIMGYQMSNQQDYTLVDRTIRQAKESAGSAVGVILHSDQGCQYTSYSYKNLTKEYGITLSMSRKGTPYDNACIENFFSILKTECLYIEKPQTIAEAKQLVDEYIEYYNYERIQLQTGLTPYELHSQAA